MKHVFRIIILSILMLVLSSCNFIEEHLFCATTGDQGWYNDNCSGY